MQNFNNSVCMITGEGSGIGAALSRTFCASKAIVILTVRNKAIIILPFWRKNSRFGISGTTGAVQ